MNDWDVIRQYYNSFRDRDLEGVRACLTPDFHFASGFGEFHGRDDMLEAIWPNVGQAWAANLRIFGEGPEYVVLYDHEIAPGAQRPPMRMAEHIRFEGSRISRVEVYVGRALSS